MLFRSGLRKKKGTDSFYQQIDAWDVLHIDEVKQWSAYLTMANIFSSLQSNQSDLFIQKKEEFEKKAEQYKAQFYLSLDLDDDGAADSLEQASDISVRRLVRK